MTTMQPRVYIIQEIFRPRRNIRRRFLASSASGGFRRLGNLTYRRRFALPTGRYATTVVYVPQTRELSVSGTFNRRILPLPGPDLRSADEKQQARRDVSFIFQYLFNLIDYVLHEYEVSAILFESRSQHPSQTRLFDRFARNLARDYNGSIEKSEPTPRFGIIQYTIHLQRRDSSS